MKTFAAGIRRLMVVSTVLGVFPAAADTVALDWSEPLDAKRYDTCVILATTDDAAAALWRTRLNEAGVTVARVKGDFTGEKAGPAGQRAVRVVRDEAAAGRHGLTGAAKIGALGVGPGARQGCTPHSACLRQLGLRPRSK